MAVTSETWDRDPFLLGTPGGTVDLRTGELREPDPATASPRSRRSRRPRRLIARAGCQFLDETFGDADLIRFIQQWGGYCLTGDISEHALVFGFGNGKNGKAVWLNTVAGIMDDYATTAAMETFTASKFDRHPTELAMLRGARLVTASETEEGRAWAESRIKQMTGGDPITARFMQQDFFTFRPTFKLTIIGNHKPVLRNVDEAARRRFNLVPFNRMPANVDPLLGQKLKAEWPGILRWLIDGCLDWQANGLVRPESVIQATESYFEDQDLMSQWLAEDCDAEPGNNYKSEATAKLFASWTEFANRAGEKPGSLKAFSAELTKRGFENEAWGHAKIRCFKGLRLKPSSKRTARTTSHQGHATMGIGYSLMPLEKPTLQKLTRPWFYRAADHLPHLRIRQEQIVVDDAPAGLGSIDHAHAELLDGSFLGGADPGHPAGEAPRQRQRTVIGRGDDGDLAGERTDAVDRRREHVHVDVRARRTPRRRSCRATASPYRACSWRRLSSVSMVPMLCATMWTRPAPGSPRWKRARVRSHRVTTSRCRGHRRSRTALPWTARRRPSSGRGT